MALEISAARPDPALLDLPWNVPLEEWPADHLVALPRGISRHVVRFAPGRHESARSRRPAELAPARVRAAARPGPHGHTRASTRSPSSPAGPTTASRWNPCLITRHLQFSLPYRAISARRCARARPTGCWTRSPCCSSGCTWPASPGATARCRTRSSAGTRAPSRPTWWTPRPASSKRLCDGQREHDIEIARVNIFGELIDLEAGGLLHEAVDPVAVADRSSRATTAVARAHRQRVSTTRRWRVDDRIRRLNDLGFDVAEMAIATDRRHVDPSSPRSWTPGTTRAGCCA